MWPFKKPLPPADALVTMMMAGIYDEIQRLKEQAKKDKQEILEAIWTRDLAEKP